MVFTFAYLYPCWVEMHLRHEHLSPKPFIYRNIYIYVYVYVDVYVYLCV